MPSTALELALWLESDRMGWLLDAMDQEKLDVQRDMVKNERRQSYENRPYGLAYETILARPLPAGPPLSLARHRLHGGPEAATLEDVKGFFRRYYAPNNASLAIAGDVTPGGPGAGRAVLRRHPRGAAGAGGGAAGERSRRTAG